MTISGAVAIDSFAPMPMAHAATAATAQSVERLSALRRLAYKSRQVAQRHQRFGALCDVGDGVGGEWVHGPEKRRAECQVGCGAAKAGLQAGK